MDLQAEAPMHSPMSSPEGWTKKVIRGAARRSVVYIAPTGERIKSKRQLEGFLKTCTDSYTISDFDWTIGGKKGNSKKRLFDEGSEIGCQENQENETPPKRFHTESEALSEISNIQVSKEPESPQRKLNSLSCSSHTVAAKAALHLSAVPDTTILCRNNQIQKIIEFSQGCLLKQKAGSLYVCGCPGTGKSLAMEKIKGMTSQWAEEAGLSPPEVVSINCTTLTDARQIYYKILHALQAHSTHNPRAVSLEHVKKLLSFKDQQKKMQLLIIDEMDYLITREQAVLYELFQLCASKNSSCILIGIANAIDLTERFLPKLRTFNCHPDVVTFPAYTKEQILAVLNQRLSILQGKAFHLNALELCARKVSAASGDMRKALHACRTAIDLFETEMKEQSSLETQYQDNTVQVDHMARALAKVFRSPVIETIQALPKHSQMILCTAVRLFRNGRKDAPLSELNKCYIGFCKTTGMHPVSAQEFSGICQVIADQGLLSLGNAREDRLKKIKLQVDHTDVVFALQGIRFFRNSLQ